MKDQRLDLDGMVAEIEGLVHRHGKVGVMFEFLVYLNGRAIARESSVAAFWLGASEVEILSAKLRKAASLYLAVARDVAPPSVPACTPENCSFSLIGRNGLSIDAESVVRTIALKGGV